MKRFKGYMDLCELLNLPDKDYASTPELFEELHDILKNRKNIHMLKYELGKWFGFSFEYNDETYFFSFDGRSEEISSLIVEEICKDLEVPCVSYDLAKIGNIRGLVSKNFKKQNAKYILGEDILVDAYIKDISYNEELLLYNNLEDIWAALEERYSAREDMPAIVEKLMNRIVDMFLIDILTGQADRGPNNWMIVEYDDGSVDLQPLFDNVRAFYAPLSLIRIIFTVDRSPTFLTNNRVDINIKKFLATSSKEFKDSLYDKLWVLSEENSERILDRLEKKLDWKLSKTDRIQVKAKILYYKNELEHFINLGRNL